MRFYDEKIAMKYGIEAGVLYQYFLFWIKNNKANGRNYKEGRFWTYNSRSALLSQFPELTENKIRGALNRLVDAGVLMRGCFNKFAWDRTTWFAFVDEPEELKEQQAGTIRDEEGNMITGHSTEPLVNITNEPVNKTEESVIETNEAGYKNQTIPYIKPNKETDEDTSEGGKPKVKNNQPPPLSLFEEFEKDYLNYYAKITARTYSDINLLLKKPIDRDDFKTMFENAKYLHESGYHWRKGMEMIYNDLDKTKTPTQAYFEFRDELRLMLRDDAETIKKRKQASVNKVKSETVENMEYDEEVEAIKRQSQKIPKEASQNLVKKLSEYYKLE